MPKEHDKHKKYKTMYGSSELYWGLGIEEETYFQFTKPIHVASPIIRSCHKAERYSVDYYSGFKTGYLTVFNQLFPDASGCPPLPFFFNGHSFEKMDLSGQHATTYEKQPKPNPRFGKSFFYELQSFCPSLFKDEYEKSFCFDGDTIEFITQEFYKARVSNIVKELIHAKMRFLKGVNDFLINKRVHRDKGLLMYPPVNPGFAVFYVYFPVLKRFTYATFLYALTRAIMYVVTSFGLLFITESFGYYGLWMLMFPLAIGFSWGVRHFEKLECSDHEDQNSSTYV